MIIYSVVRIAAWLWGFQWPISSDEARGFCAYVSCCEILLELLAVGMLCKHLYDNRKNGGAK